jgi:hypothetical protein
MKLFTPPIRTELPSFIKHDPASPSEAVLGVHSGTLAHATF